MESDEGTFTPHGLSFSGSPTAGCILQEILKLTAGINTTHYETPQVLISLSLADYRAAYQIEVSLSFSLAGWWSRHFTVDVEGCSRRELNQL
jgi:hypothetical protein